jgi:hypothetical protein
MAVRPRQVLTPPSGRTGLLAFVTAVLVAAGLLTVSWERLGNLTVAGYNAKLPVLLFSAAALLAAPRWGRWLREIRARSAAVRWTALLAVAVVLVLVVRGLTSLPIGLGLAQIVAVASGAVAPALALLASLRSASDVVWALRWFVTGAVIASLFGFYQLFAFYTGLPQGITYTGVGTSGEGGRISAFNYEPAYFAYFIVLAIGAVIALARLTGRRVSWLAIVFFALVLVLVNVRALLFVLPLLTVLLALQWRANRRLLLRGLLAGVVVFGVVSLVPLAVAAAQDAAAPRATSTAADPARSTVPSAGSSKETGPTVPAAPQLPTDVLDPSEPSSNGPRVELYKAVLAVDLQHLALGVGPGHLRDALAANGYVAPNQGANVVANNLWLQAAADGGVLLLALEGAVVAALAVLWWRRRRTAAHPLASALLAVLLVGGMLTSYFFDIKIWVVLALVLVLAESDQGADPAPTAAS